MGRAEMVGNGSSVQTDPHKRTARIKFRVAMFIDSTQLFLFWHEPRAHASSRYCYFERVVEGFASAVCIRMKLVDDTGSNVTLYQSCTS